jgi:SAM-dependent methyltransferase
MPRFDQARRRWDRAADAEPYYSVLSQPRFLAANVRENPAPFFETGEADVEKLIASIRAADRDAALHSALEFGCGPGRRIPAFLRRGIAVTAVDISPRMLQIAGENIARFGGSAVFLETSAFVADASLRFDLVTIARVMQHVPSSEGVELVRMLASRVRRGGYLQLDLPFRTTRSAMSRTALALRTNVPPLNALANAAKGRPLATPVAPVHVHSLDDILGILNDCAMEIVQLITQTEGELTTASILARAGDATAPRSDENHAPIARAPREITPLAPDHISPADMIRTITLEDLSARAEAYFARMDSWDEQLAKPFGSTADAPAMLISIGAVLHGMQLVPGMTVLDFGGGTGWLTRALSQLGCRAILSDVSPTALRIARESIATRPPINAKEEVRYVLFDGRRIDLPDERVDRILCFDSFHHVPNPDDILREFGRILKPGGLAAFSEPGPEHSRSAQSQFEMRVHGVLENDVDVHHIRTVAREAGFDDFRLGVFDGTPPYLPLDEFEDFLAEGAALRRAARHMRDFTANVRTFTMRKRGEEQLDSRTARGLLSRVSIDIAANAVAGEEIPYTATVENIGTATWLPSSTQTGGVSLGAHLYRDGRLVNFDFAWLPLIADPLPPGAQITASGKLPPLEAGHYTLDFDCVANRVTWFEQAGSTVARRTIEVQSA